MKNQYEMPIYGDVSGEIIDVPWDLVAICPTKADAYRLCMNHSRVKRSDGNWADLLGLTAGHLSQILNQRTNTPKYMPPDAEVELIRISGNRAVTQWLELAAKGQLRKEKSKEDRERELLEELARIRQSA